MSAFIVSHDHIDGLLTFATRKSRYGTTVSYWTGKQRIEITAENATEIGTILLLENERSVRHRYSDFAEDDLPGGKGADSYRFRPWSPLQGPSPIEVLKACNCYDYQACETDDYEASMAWKIINAIRHGAISALPGYDEANGWTLERPARPEFVRGRRTA